VNDRNSEPERGWGSEWELIKIILEGDGNSSKMNMASSTRLRLTTKIDQAHVATGVPLDLETNTRPSDPRTQRNTKPRVYRPTPVRPVSTTGQTGPSLKAPKSPNRPTDLQTDPNSKQLRHRTTTNTPRRLPEQKPTKGCTGQTSAAWTARDEQHPRVNSPKSKLRSPESLHGLEQDFGDNRNTS
jgi:hypothetical protein